MLRRRIITRVLLVALLVGGLAREAASQTNVTPAAQDAPAEQVPPAAPDPAATPAPAENPGLINELGKLFKGPSSLLPDLKSPREALDSLTRAAAPGSLVTGRAACPVSANGAPDCKVGADLLCQAKGYKLGKSLDTDSAQTCSAKYALSGKPCRMENFVTRAACL